MSAAIAPSRKHRRLLLDNCTETISQGPPGRTTNDTKIRLRALLTGFGYNPAHVLRCAVARFSLGTDCPPCRDAVTSGCHSATQGGPPERYTQMAGGRRTQRYPLESAH